MSYCIDTVSEAFGPDEYHPNVNNSVYVNIVAKLTLDAAAELTNGKAMNYSEDNTSWTAYNKYKYYADRILVNFDEKNQYHPEYDGYKIGKFMTEFVKFSIMLINNITILS